MKIRYDAEQSSKVSEDIEIGTVFSGSLLGEKSVFLKTYLGIIDLGNPVLTWRDSKTLVRNYKEINVELVVLP